MRNLAIVGVVLLMMLAVFGAVGFAQGGAGQTAGPEPGLEVPLITPGPGWKACPRCQNDAYTAEDRRRANVETRKFDPRDIAGVWSGNPSNLGANGTALDNSTLPPFTPYGQQLYEATISESVEWSSKDPMNICDPLGFPRSFTYNYGFEFLQLPDRVLQFFEWGHTWRTIWTDGRPLPSNPPIPRFFGHAVGRWEGDTFVVESNGYDERTWLVGENGRLNAEKKQAGLPHSDELRIVERYKRVNYGLLEQSLTVIDPKVYTAPWTTTARVVTLSPNTELAEHLCIPSDAIDFNNRNTAPALTTR